MKLSIIIPAFNEAKLIGGCLQSVFHAVQEIKEEGFETEVIVVDNNSRDETGRLAAAAGAQVVFEPVNQIARARNAGAANATGDWLLFIDADSWLASETLRQMLDRIHSGRFVGGGALIALEPIPPLVKFALGIWNGFSRLAKVAAGSFIFCRADAFRAVGGFGEHLYAAEELDLTWKLRKWGKSQGLHMTILTHTRHTSSGRKFALYTPREQFQYLFRILFFPRRTLTDPKQLEYFYGGRR